MSHTPGPWEVSRGAGSDPLSIEAPAKTIAHVKHATDMQTTDANAHLIAAAPEMLEMLEELEWCALNSWDQPICPSCLRGISHGHYSTCPLATLLKKARGES